MQLKSFWFKANDRSRNKPQQQGTTRTCLEERIMEIELKKKASSLIIKPIGELSVYSANEFKQCFATEEPKYLEIEIDLSRISRLDTAGFQLLLMTRCEAGRGSKSIRYVNPSGEVLRVCAIYQEKIEDWNTHEQR
jgi:anti-sigma B factor antagonist